MRTTLLLCVLTMTINQMACVAEERTMTKTKDDLLRNPRFEFHSIDRGGDENVSGAAACWDTERWRDVEVRSSNLPAGVVPPEGFNAVKLKPGKKIWQFMTLPEIGCENGDVVSLSVKGWQPVGDALATRLCVMRAEAGEGEWSPKDLGFIDGRTFQRHGRGELVRGPVKEATSPDKSGPFTVKLEGLTVTGKTEQNRTASPKHENLVGILVEFENVSKTDDVWIHSPSLTFGKTASGKLEPARPIPDLYRKIPKTIAKLLKGEPIHILALGSSIDRGSANPQLYLYDEDPDSPTFKQPIGESRKFDLKLVGRPDLKGYVPWFQHYFMYTGRLRRALMRKFNLPVEDILLNVMACDGSCVGESHSGFEDYAEFRLPPSASVNGNQAASWKALHPKHFKDGKKPAPDLVIFGHGHNEKIDAPDTAAAYEGAIRWFQRHYPDVEFVICMYTKSPENPKSRIYTHMPELAERYGIPFIDVGSVCEGLRKTCNQFALTPDGGHPQAGMHYMWGKLLERAFELPADLEPGLEQKRLPKRYNPYSYGWESDMISFPPGHPRLNGNMMIVEDTQYNLWASGDEKNLKIRIDGEETKDAGRARPNAKRDVRNSTSVYGRLSLGDRHVVEVVGKDAKIECADGKVCLNRTFYPIDAPQWKGVKSTEAFKSEWGAPYGDVATVLKRGESVSIKVSGTDLSICYVDQTNGGSLDVKVDGSEPIVIKANEPYVDAEGKKHFMENRRGLTGLKPGNHDVTVTCVEGTVPFLGMFTYDSSD